MFQGRQKTDVGEEEHIQESRMERTAEEVYLAVKSQGSRLSLATVYNALEALVEAGLASKFAFGDGSARYDIRTDQHDHIHCLGCGMLRDVPSLLEDTPVARVPGVDFEVTSY